MCHETPYPPVFGRLALRHGEVFAGDAVRRTLNSTVLSIEAQSHRWLGFVSFGWLSFVGFGWLGLFWLVGFC